MTITLTAAKRNGERVYVWHDTNGREWRIYRSFSMWRYRREDHDISSIGYLTLDDAKKTLEAALKELSQ